MSRKQQELEQQRRQDDWLTIQLATKAIIADDQLDGVTIDDLPWSDDDN